MIKVITHSGGFHADDVFAVAAFQLLLGKENVEVIRTREDAVIETGDYIVDAGLQYDHEARRYDHHQPGAPVRENGIPYAAFGLVWKHYGAEICDSDEVATKIEEKLCVPVDASDNALNIWEPGQFDLRPLEWDDILQSWRAEPTLGEDADEQFLKAVDVAREYLLRRIQRETIKVSQKKAVADLYENTDEAGRAILISDTYVPRSEFVQHEEVNVVVFPRELDVSPGWVAVAVQKNEHDYATRVRFPESWAGLRDAELAEMSGFADAKFCHKDRYMFIADSKESAIAAAQLAMPAD